MDIKILLVEDDHNLGEVLQEYLELKGFHTTLCRDGEEGWQTYQTQSFDMCLIDIMLPKMDGFALTERIRKQDNHTPIIFLTAKSLIEDTLKGLRLGADDYLTKPFSMEELLLRIQAILRRAQSNTPSPKLEAEQYVLGKFLFDYTAQKLFDGEAAQKLTSKEAALLKMLCDYQNQTLARSEALKAIWHDDTYFNARSMDVYITKLRKYLKGDPRLEILNVHGQGFRLVVPQDVIG
ncbi:response regulator transcription factor [Eisenibacter elegans]|uniref:response regulator transcription factor n=1 Tax=Eisenibacter elegans TaxID=997 RepID=UPI0003FC2990|nr:response regulator transcription factor [Eisenibacter elegans]